jgi:hypothetical protein
LSKLIAAGGQLSKKNPTLTWVDAEDQHESLFVWNSLAAVKIPTGFFDPIDESDSYYATIAAFDITTNDVSARKVLAQDLRKLWNKERRRIASDEETKPYNYTMSVDLEGMMNDLANHYRWKRHEIVAHLIRKDHRKVTLANAEKTDRLATQSKTSKIQE